MQSQLRDWGIEVDSVANGLKALTQLRTVRHNVLPYDLMILKHPMPTLDGIVLASVIKADPHLETMRLVLLTLLGQRVEDVQHIGFCGYLTKPLRQSHLYDCMLAATGRQATTAVQASISQGLPDNQALSRVKVLVVEDNIVNQRVAVRMLEKHGCRVDVVANGYEAVDATACIAYDCIFMDCQMPEMDGFEATTLIRQREMQTGQHIPIIAMTANAMLGDREQCLEAGMDDYVSKPVKSAELLAVLQRWTHPSSHEQDRLAHITPSRFS
jgi:CheY-like chemotaxis protein